MGGFPVAGGKTQNNVSASLSSDAAIASTGTQTIVQTAALAFGTYFVVATLVVASATTAGITDVQIVIPGVGAVEAASLFVPLAASTPTTVTIYGIATINSVVNNQLTLQVNSGVSGGPVGAVAKHSSSVGGFGPTTMITAIQIA